MTKTFENSGSEKEFLDIYRREEIDKYVKPSVTVDSVIFRYYEGKSPNRTYQAKKPSPSWEIRPQWWLRSGARRPQSSCLSRSTGETSVKLDPDH